MNTLGKINRPIRFWGLSAGQFGLFMVINALIIIVFVFIDMYPVIIVTVMGAIFYVSSILFKNLKREHKAGNPNYLSSLSVKSATPKKIVDKHKVFNFIMKKNDWNNYSIGINPVQYNCIDCNTFHASF